MAGGVWVEVYMPGMNWSDPQTFWLNAANLGLGVVTLICLAVLGYGVVKDMLDRGRRRRAGGSPLPSIS